MSSFAAGPLAGANAPRSSGPFSPDVPVRRMPFGSGGLGTGTRPPHTANRPDHRRGRYASRRRVCGTCYSHAAHRHAYASPLALPFCTSAYMIHVLLLIVLACVGSRLIGCITLSQLPGPSPLHCSSCQAGTLSSLLVGPWCPVAHVGPCGRRTSRLAYMFLGGRRGLPGAGVVVASSIALSSPPADV